MNKKPPGRRFFDVLCTTPFWITVFSALKDRAIKNFNNFDNFFFQIFDHR
jgi:hypothetical protein